MPHFVADELRRRGVPVRHLHVWDDYDRFRKVPAGVDPSWAEHIGRPCPPCPTRGSATRRGPSTTRSRCVTALHDARRRDGGDLPDRALPRRRLPRGGAARRTPSRRDRRGAGAAPDQEGRAPTPRRADDDHAAQEAEALADSVAHDDDDGRHRGRLLPVQALLPRLRPRHDHGDGVRRRHHRPRLHLLGVRLPRHDQPRDAGRGQAGLEGRLADAVGLRARRLRAGRHGPRDPGVVVHRRPRAGRVGVGLPAAGVVRLRLRRVRRRAEDVVVRRRRADRRATRCGCSSRRSCAGSTCAASPSRPSTSTSVPRSCACTTSGTRWAARRRPEARHPGARLRARGGDRVRRPAADPAGGRAVPDARRRWPT